MGGTLCGGRMAQLVEHLTQKPGTVLTWVQFPGVTRDFSPRVTFSADSLTVFVQPQRSIASINICVPDKNP